MKVAIRGFAITVTLMAVSMLSVPEALADDSTSQLLNSKTVQEAFDRAYFKHDKNFYRNTDWDRQATLMFNFWPPENEITWDAELVNALYRDALSQQSTGDPYLRVQDLPNPFCQSLQGTQNLCGAVPENPAPAAFEPTPVPAPMTAPPPVAPRSPAIPALY
jgi:hypothetical protein